jgi:uroporphyrinogen-III synthase
VPVTTYGWALPDDTEPLRQAVQATIDGEFDVLLFTSAQQIENLLQVADSNELKAAWLLAADECTIGSIGPTCSDALRDVGLTVHVEASPPKMAHLIRQTLDAARHAANT